jgi:hypothetical protein
MFEYLSKLVGQNVAIGGTRYTYRGKVVDVSDDGVVLDEVFMVEEVESSTSSEVKEEDKVPGKMFVAFGGVEKIFQPSWVSSKGKVKK